MAAYREHITVSGLLGIGYGTAATLGLGFTPVQAALAGFITGIGGMLPDLDSESGRPVREIFSVTAAMAPMVMMSRLLEWGRTTDGAMLLAVLVYVAVRYGGAMVLGIFTEHRGMFHSVPAMLIAAELVFLGYKSDSLRVKLLMGTGVALGFLSHLILDEIYSVQWTGVRVKLKASAGSALKLAGKDFGANVVTFGLLATLTYVVLVDGGVVAPAHLPGRPPTQSIPHASKPDVFRG
ncbi:MAG: metal-dependent hydrolase [Planctomycetales bacterium]|nr:metal-dependent hydrolase [Planctomycetales bacterium]